MGEARVRRKRSSRIERCNWHATQRLPRDVRRIRAGITLGEHRGIRAGQRIGLRMGMPPEQSNPIDTFSPLTRAKVYFYCRHTSGRQKRAVILGFSTAKSCGATTKRRGVVARNWPRVSASQFVAPILRYMPSKGHRERWFWQKAGSGNTGPAFCVRGSASLGWSLGRNCNTGSCGDGGRTPAYRRFFQK